MISRRLVPIVCLVFFLSGSSALVFETVWFQIASRVLGSSVWSAAAVLMAFMSGLALGNAAMAYYGQRIRLGFRFYIIAELTIGVTGVLAVWLLPILSPWIAKQVSGIGDAFGLLNAIRFLIAFLVLLVPAVAMGTTLPILQKLIHKQDSVFSSSMGKLYGWNTLGALAGVLLAEFVLIEAFGLRNSALIACLLNFSAALLILKLFGGLSTSADAEAPLLRGRLNRAGIALLLAPFLTGLALLALEVVWFRYLLLAHGGSSTTFSIMLATILGGIGVGGLIAPLLKERIARNLDGYLFGLPLLAAFLTLLSFYAYSRIFEVLLYQITDSDFHFWWAAWLLMFPTSVLSGVLFPLYGEALYRHSKAVTLSSGALTLVNTVGAALGSGLASFVLLPMLGIENSLVILAIVYLLIALAWRLFTSSGEGSTKVLLPGVATVLFTATVFLVHGSVERNYRAFGQGFLPEWQLVKLREGLNETLGYFERRLLGKPYAHRLITNNFSMSGTTTPAKRYMKLYVYLPYLLHKNIRSVLQISYGVGNTAEAVTRLDSLQRFDIVDLSPDILELSHIIHDASGRYPLADPRARVHIEDGRFFLQTTSASYDLITAEPPLPKNAGVVNLYSKEYFRLISDRLNRDGMATYWLPTHALADLDLLAIVRAYCDVFPDCSLWNGSGLDFMLVGTKSGLKPLADADLLAGWNSVIREDLGDLGFDTPGQLLATFMGDAAFLNELTRDVPPVTDDFPRRISPSAAGLKGNSTLDAFLLNIARRRDAVANSTYLQGLFSSATIADAVAELKQEAALTAVWASKYSAATGVATYNDVLFEALQDPKRRFLATALLNSSPTELDIIQRSGEAHEDSDPFRTAYIKFLLVNRRFSEASAFAWATVERLTGRMQAFRDEYHMYLLAMALDGRAAQAQLQLLPSTDQFLLWFRGRFLATDAGEP